MRCEKLEHEARRVEEGVVDRRQLGGGWNSLGQRCGLQHAIDIYRLTDMGMNKHGCFDVKRTRFSLSIKG
jgi:hypothetical protein